MSLRDQLEHALRDTYVIERELGAGGMSRVFVAEERALKRKVAIKVLPPELGAAINAERFQREIQLAATLQHPHIVPVFTAGDVDGIPYFTMPLVEGESLRAHLARGELPIAEVVSILRDVAKALAYAHAHGVVHRDIKPDNVLLSSRAATVMDFGVAKALTESTNRDAALTQTGIALGTPAYMAPEQASADPHVDARADLYALGVLAYEMLTGHPPFVGRSAQQLLAAHMTETPPPVGRERESVPPALAALVAHCLAKRPADRPQTAEEVLHSLESLSTPTGGVVPTDVAFRAPRRSWVNRVGAGVAIAAGITMVFVWQSKKGAASADGLPGAAPAIQQSRPAAPRFRPTSIVVAPFTNMTGDTSLNVLGAIAAQTLSDGLSQLDSVVVMSPSVGMLDSTGALRRFARADAVRSLGREAKAASVAWGSFQRDGDSLRFQAQVIDVSDGRVQITLDAVRTSPKTPTAAIEELREKLVSAIDATSIKERLGAMGRPPKMAAYREFLAGLHERWYYTGTGNSSLAALTHFENASRLDTTFSIALHYVVLMHSNVSSVTTASRATRITHNRAADSAYKILLGRRAVMTAVELDFLETTRAAVHGEANAQLAVARRLQARDSSLRMVNNLMLAAYSANRPREVLSAIRAWPSARIPDNWTNMMLWECTAHHLLGDYKAELRAAKQWRLRAPMSANLMRRELYAHAALGNVADVRRIVDSVGGLWDGTGSPTLHGDLANELRAHGHAGEASKYVDEGLTVLYGRPASEWSVVGRRTQLARLLLLKGSLDSSKAMYSRFAVADTQYNGGRIGLAVAAALQGDSSTALQVIRALDSIAVDPYDRGRARWQQARIAAALGRKEQAVRYLRAALTAGTPFDFGTDWHADPAFEPLRNYPPFTAILRPKG